VAKNPGTHTPVLLTLYRLLFSHFGPQNWWPGDSPFEVAVGAILTQNTNWSNVEKAIDALKREKALNARKLHALPRARLASLIRPAGYFNVKAERLANFLEYLCAHYRGSMKEMGRSTTARLRAELLAVKGIGPETADSILLYALEKPVFVIDAYTGRVLKRHNLIHENAAYHDMQDLFHEGLPHDISLYNEYHALLVMTGKHYCKPQPKCKGCPLEKV
jgi:endonuclease-3 related protein